MLFNHIHVFVFVSKLNLPAILIAYLAAVFLRNCSLKIVRIIRLNWSSLYNFCFRQKKVYSDKNSIDHYVILKNDNTKKYAN